MLELTGYHVEALLYEGSRSRLFHAKRINDDAPVILKTHCKKPAKLTELNRFRREFEFGSSIQHVGLRRYYDLLFHADGLALSMEDIQGKPFQENLVRFETNVAHVLSVGLQLAKILEVLHKKNILHGAIHPSNILLTQDTATVKLIDFSSSCLFNYSDYNTSPIQENSSVIPYLSPEQTGAIHSSIDARSDRFSLGVLLYRLLTGHLPFRAEQLSELRERQRGMLPVPPSEMSPDCPQALSDLVSRLLERDPKNRYSSSKELITDLEQCIQQWNQTGQINPSALLCNQPRRLTPETLSPSGIHDSPSSQSIDLDAFAKAALAINSEISLKNILSKILEITAETIGGYKGKLLLKNKDAMRVEAVSERGKPIETLLGIPLSEDENIAHEVVRYVLDCGEAVLIEDSSRSRFHALDSYLRQGGKRSILCGPIQSKNSVFGIIFLETEPGTSPFSQEDLNVFRMLQPHIGISLENARLYHEMVALNIKLNQKIEEHHETENRLRKNQEKLELATTGADLGIWEWNLGTDAILANSRYFTMLGFAPNEFVANSKQWLSQVHPDDLETATHEYSKIIRGKSTSIKSEYRMRTKNGEYRWILDFGKIVEYDARGLPRRLSGIHQDITERKVNSFREREVEANMLQNQKLEAIGTLAGGVAHEINNPINIIMNFGQLIMDEVDPQSTAYQDAQHIVQESCRVADIVKNLLAFARQDQESYGATHVRAIVESTLSLTKKILRQDHIVVEHSIPSDLPEVVCHHQEIMQVLMNLVTNARDALNDKYRGNHEDKIIYIDANLLHLNEKKFVRVIVEDHGTGIPKCYQERIFDPFYTSKPHGKGTGLGLSISHSIIKDHGGKLSFKTEEGRYTRFFFDLPVDFDDLPQSKPTEA